MKQGQDRWQQEGPSEGGRQEWLPVTHHSYGADQRGCSFSALASEKVGGCKGSPTLTRRRGFPVPASCHPRRPTLAFLVHDQPGTHGSWTCSPVTLPPEPEGRCNPTTAAAVGSVLLPAYNQSSASPASAEGGGLMYHPCARARATGLAERG